MCFAFFFTANKDVIASLLESVPFALISGVICGTWRFINWEPPHPTSLPDTFEQANSKAPVTTPERSLC